MIRQAVLYLSKPEDVAAALLAVAGQPVAFRALMAAVRAGVQRIAVPGVFRGSELERAIARTPSARAATVWVHEGADPPTDSMLLVPATALVPVTSLAAIGASPPTTVLAESRSGQAPIVAAARPASERLWPRLAAGEPVGQRLQETIGEPGVAIRVGGAWYVRVTTPETARRAETLLYESLGSPTDTRLDALLHRRLSRPLTRVAVAWRLRPNQITLASLLVGVTAAWCLWRGSVESALLGLLLYAISVVFDHADGEVARLTLSESRVGAWLDVVVDTIVHALIVLALGLTAERMARHGAVLGILAATGVVAGAASTHAGPLPSAARGLGRLLRGLSNRNGFYGLLVAFVLALAWVPATLSLFMGAAAIGTHAFWLSHVAYRVARPHGPAPGPVGEPHGKK